MQHSWLVRWLWGEPSQDRGGVCAPSPAFLGHTAAKQPSSLTGCTYCESLWQCSMLWGPVHTSHFRSRLCSGTVTWDCRVLNTTEVKVVHEEVGVRNPGLRNPLFKDIREKGGGLGGSAKPEKVGPEWTEGRSYWVFGFVLREKEGTGNF